MSRFVYIADIHLGATENGYHQQPRYTEQLLALLTALDAWIQTQGDIAFVLHGGDMVDQATPTTLRAARELFRLAIPVYLCLGNHDLTVPDAATRWLREAPEFFPDQRLTYSLTLPDCVIHVVPTQWCATPFFWEEEQTPHFLAEQHAYLTTALKRDPDRQHLLCTHSAVLGVSPELSLLWPVSDRATAGSGNGLCGHGRRPARALPNNLHYTRRIWRLSILH